VDCDTRHVYRPSTSTSQMVEGRASHLKETSCNFTGIVATCWSLARTPSHYREGNHHSVVLRAALENDRNAVQSCSEDILVLYYKITDYS